MTVTSLVAVVTPPSGKIINTASEFWKDEKMVYTLCIYVKSIVGNRVTKL